jgi:hypothetical protein
MWRADSWKQLFDAVGCAERVERIFSGLEEPDTGLDCDEFAIWAAASLRTGKMRGVLVDDVTNISFLTVTWRDAKKMQGHNACLFRLKDKWVYIDYGMPKGHAVDIEGTVKALLAEYAEGDAELITWSLHCASDLKHIETHWGFES